MQRFDHSAAAFLHHFFATLYTYYTCARYYLLLLIAPLILHVCCFHSSLPPIAHTAGFTFFPPICTKNLTERGTEIFLFFFLLCFHFPLLRRTFSSGNFYAIIWLEVFFFTLATTMEIIPNRNETDNGKIQGFYSGRKKKKTVAKIFTISQLNTRPITLH